MEIKNNHAIVTGGSSGLGFAVVKELLAKNCAKISVIDVKDFADVKTEIADDQSKIDYYKCDVTDKENVIQCLDKIFANSQKPKILVQCAGIVHAQKTAWINRDDGKAMSYDMDAWERVININLIGSYRILSYFSKKLLETEHNEKESRGVIINTSSVAATDGQMGQSSYSASKAAIMGMSLPIARDLAKVGIRINSIMPGIFDTPMVGGMPEKVKESLAASIPFPSRLGQGDDYAKLCIHMIENEYINGAAYRIDGAVRLNIK